MGVADCRAMSPATMEESMPPERKTPSGTSLTMRRRTARESRRFSSRQSSPSSLGSVSSGTGMSQ